MDISSEIAKQTRLAKEELEEGHALTAAVFVGGVLRFLASAESRLPQRVLSAEKQKAIALMQQVLNAVNWDEIRKHSRNARDYLERLRRYGCELGEEFVLALTLFARVADLDAIARARGQQIDDLAGAAELIREIFSDPSVLEKTERGIRKHNPLYLSISNQPH
jgi:hypothetical protein